MMPGRVSGGSSRKRPHRDVDDGQDGSGDDGASVGEGSSSLRPDTVRRGNLSPSAVSWLTQSDGPQNKRPRLSGSSVGQSSRARAAQVVDMADQNSEESDREESPQSEDELQPSLATNYEKMRDGDFRHLQFEAQDDQRATQRIHQRQTQSRKTMQRLGENRVAENGILESIICVNFMCHTRLHCELGPLLNFIVGENGSGKSAILTAITLCLGGKASSTNRGGSLKAFIKEGQDQALLTVKLKNQGADAYKPDLYGDAIIIERHFSRHGSTGFKVKSATGKTIETKKSEVEEIVEFYCLQVDNPLNVLSQDNARQFLNASSNSMKYKFFIQGVQLEQLDKDYELVKELLDANEQKLPEQEERVRAAKAAYESAEKLYKAVQNNHELRRQKRLYTHQLVWAQVEEQERKLEDRDNAILAADASIAHAAQAIEESALQLRAQDERLAAAEKALADAREDQADASGRLAKATDDFNSAKTDMQKLHADERDAHGRLGTAAARVKELGDKVNEEKRRLEDANGDAAAEAQARLQEAKQLDEDLLRQLNEATARVPDLDNQHSEAKQAAEQGNMDLQRKRDEVKAITSKIHDLKRRRGSPLDAYERELPDLLKMIERDGGFAEKPVGPIATHITVLKPAWSSIVEKTLGGILNGFIVTSKRDQLRLQGMMRRLNVQRCPILIANRQAINTEGKEPDRAFDTILRILEFDDALVRNQLIINNSIEQVVLVEDRMKAEDVMFSGPAAPRNVVACLCRHDGKRGEGLRLTNRAGNMGTTPVVPGNQKPRMKSDVDGQIAAQEDLLGQLQMDLRGLQDASAELQQTARACLEAMNRNNKGLQHLQNRRRRALVSITEIEEELDKFDGADGRLQSLEAELQNAQIEKDQYGNQFGDMHIKKGEQNQRMSELKKRLEQEKLLYRDFEASVDKAAEKVNRYNDARRMILRDRNDLHEEVDKTRDDKRIAEEKRERQKAVVEEFKTLAASVSQDRVHIADGETHAAIEKKLEAVNKQLQERHRRIGMTDEQVELRVVETKKAHERAVDFLEGTKDQIARMKQNLLGRLNKWRHFQRYISASSRSNFQFLLSERGFRGRLLIDHQRKNLSVQVEPDETRRSAVGRDTKTLSGGEKSFSSICLLLSIWEAMGSPLRCLDEFDVFMDNVNRAISTDMLVSCRGQYGRALLTGAPRSLRRGGLWAGSTSS